jgi:hypothetical protein
MRRTALPGFGLSLGTTLDVKRTDKTGAIGDGPAGDPVDAPATTGGLGDTAMARG